MPTPRAPQKILTDNFDISDESVTRVTSSWLLRARSGDQQAWHKLERASRGLILWWCRRGGVSERDLDDVLQETLLALFRALPDYQHQNFTGFLWAIVRRKIQDHWRIRGKGQDPEGGSRMQELLKNVEAESNEATGPVSRGGQLLFEGVVRLVRAEFAEHDWQAFWASAVEQRAAADIAASLGISRNQVYLARSRILRRIRQEFGEIPGA